MKVLCVTLDYYQLSAFMLDIQQSEVLPVYDINDRSSIAYTLSLLLNGNNVAVSNYASNVVLGLPVLAHSIKEFDSQINGYYYSHNVFEEFLTPGFNRAGTFSSEGILSLILKKIMFDAQYVGNFSNLSSVVFIIPDSFDKNLVKIFEDAVVILNLDIQSKILKLGDLLEYANPSFIKGNFEKKNNWCVLLFGKETYIISNQGNKSIPLKSFSTGYLSFKESLYKLLISAAGCYGMQLSDHDRIALDNAYSDILLELNSLSVTDPINLNVELCSASRHLKIGVRDIVVLIREYLSPVINSLNLLISELHPGSIEIKFYGDIFNFNASGLILEKALKSMEIIDIEIYGNDRIIDYLYPYLFDFCTFRIQDSAGGMNRNIGYDLYMTVFDSKKDGISKHKIFSATDNVPCFYNCLVQGRFNGQDRLYFEIHAVDSSGVEKISAKVIVTLNTDLDFGSEMILNVKFSYGSDRKMIVTVSENFSGKKMEVTMLYSDSVNYLTMQQFNAVKSMRILNNYMDRKKEAQLGIF